QAIPTAMTQLPLYPSQDSRKGTHIDMMMLQLRNFVIDPKPHRRPTDVQGFSTTTPPLANVPGFPFFWITQCVTKILNADFLDITVQVESCNPQAVFQGKNTIKQVRQTAVTVLKSIGISFNDGLRRLLSTGSAVIQMEKERGLRCCLGADP